MRYPRECKHCKKYQYEDKYCCKEAFHEINDNSVLVNIRGTHHIHDVTLYVPVYQINFDKDGKPLMFPTFEYSMGDATHDEQMAWSFEPDYVLTLKGTFDAKTQPFIIKGDSDDKPTF